MADIGKNTECFVFSACLTCALELEKSLICSRCKIAQYCSKKCQREHWKVHKSQCNRQLQEMEKAAEWNQGRSLRLLQQFKQRNLALGMAVVRAFPDKRSFLKQPPPNFVWLSVTFDYNYCSFVPEFPAELQEMSNLQENHSIALEGERLPMEEGNVEHTLLIDYKGLHFVMRMTMYAKAAWDFHRMSWGDIEDQCRMIKLTSSLFSTFDRKPNMELQLDVLTNHQDFHQFLDCA